MLITDLHLRLGVESITDDNVEPIYFMTRKYSFKRSGFLRFNLYFCHVYRWIFFFCNIKPHLAILPSEVKKLLESCEFIVF